MPPAAEMEICTVVKNSGYQLSGRCQLQRLKGPFRPPTTTTQRGETSIDFFTEGLAPEGLSETPVGGLATIGAS